MTGAAVLAAFSGTMAVGYIIGIIQTIGAAVLVSGDDDNDWR